MRKGIHLYERRHERLLPMEEFLRRLAKHALVASAVLFGSLGIGILGYHYLENLSWVDSLLNASMILGGMGPVNTLQTVAGKIFASAYALFSGVVFLAITGILFAPVYHRFLHRFHLDVAENDQVEEVRPPRKINPEQESPSK